jgi:hypothetical protein
MRRVLIGVAVYAAIALLGWSMLAVAARADAPSRSNDREAT